MMNNNYTNISIEDSYRMLNQISKNEVITQREFANMLGYSLGKVNYLLKALVEKGFIKIENFSNSTNKFKYRYVLTPKGLKEKYIITKEYLIIKEKEYILLSKEIEKARIDLKNDDN